MPDQLVNRLVVNCNRGVVITPQLQEEAARLRAAVVCGPTTGPAVLEVDYSSVIELQQIAARTPTYITPNGRVQRDDRELRAATRRVENQFEFAVYQTNVEEIISQQVGRPVHVGVRGMRGQN